MAEKQKAQGIILKDRVNGSVYSQLVGVTVTDFELTLEFIYVNPRPDPTQGKIGHVVARVTLPQKAAEGLAQIIVDTIKQHEKKKGKKNGRKS